MEIYVKGFWKILAYIIVFISALVTVIACYFHGLKNGLFVGALAFLIMGGLEIGWCALTSPSKEEVRKRNYQEKLKFTKETQNNPTIR